MLPDDFIDSHVLSSSLRPILYIFLFVYDYTRCEVCNFALNNTEQRRTSIKLYGEKNTPSEN